MTSTRYRMQWIYRLLAVISILMAIIVFVIIIRGETIPGLSSNQAFIIVLALIFISISPYLVYTVVEIRTGKRAWREIAKQTGMTYKRGEGPGIPDIGHVTGKYGGRQLSLFVRSYYPVLDYEPDYQTILTIQMNRSLDGEINIVVDDRFTSNQDKGHDIDPFDEVVDIQSNPDHLKRAITFPPDVRHSILKLKRNTAIQIQKRNVTLSLSPDDGMENDIQYLYFLFNLLSNLANIVEQGQ